MADPTVDTEENEVDRDLQGDRPALYGAEPSSVYRRKRTEVEIRDETVGDKLELRDGVAATTGHGEREFFKVHDIEAAAPRIRARRFAKGVVALLVAAAAAACILAMAFGLPGGNGSTDTASGQSASSYDNLGIIHLESFYGLAVDDAAAKLGENFALEANMESPSGSDAAMYSVYVNVAELEDEWSSAPTRVVLMTDASRVVVGVGYTVSMDRAGFAPEPFDELVGNDEALLASLDAAGISDVVPTYAAPDPASYTTYVDPTAEAPVVARYSTTFTGATGYTNLPDKWSVTFAYDYTSEGDDGSVEILDKPVRTIEIVLD